MNIHLAGIESISNRVSWRYKNVELHENYLITFAHYGKTKNKQLQDKMVEITFKEFPNKKIILDSGAFSRSAGVVDFTLEDYISFLHKYGKLFFAYITLDIPMRGILTTEKIEFSFVETQKNLDILEKEGLTPLPVYQRKWNKINILEKYLEKYDYICIGGTATGIFDNEEDMFRYLDNVFELNSKYKKKLHGLGQTQDIVLKKYPFYTVDSTSWLQGTKSATIYENIMDKYKPVGVDNKAFPSWFLPPDLYDGFNGIKTNYVNRLNYNIAFYTEYERILKELWRHRGVDWDKGIVK